MLLSKGLRFNTYQQMQAIRASANQRSVSLLRASAGADEHRKVSPSCRERPNPNIYEIICWLHLSTHTYAAEHPCSVHAPLPTGVLGTAWQMCPAHSQHICLVLLKSFNLGTISNTTHTGWECHCASGTQNHRRGVFWTQRLCFSRDGRNSLKLLQMGRFLFYFKSSTQIFQTALQPETGAQLSKVPLSLKQPMQLLMSITTAEVSQSTMRSSHLQPCREPVWTFWSCYNCQSSPAQHQLGDTSVRHCHPSVRHCHPSVSTRAVQVSREMVATHSFHEKHCVAHIALEKLYSPTKWPSTF